jgi:hypothetical protein
VLYDWYFIISEEAFQRVSAPYSSLPPQKDVNINQHKKFDTHAEESLKFLSKSFRPLLIFG